MSRSYFPVISVLVSTITAICLLMAAGNAVAQVEEFEPIDSSVCADCHEASRHGSAFADDIPLRSRWPRMPRLSHRSRHRAPSRARRTLLSRLPGMPQLPRGSVGDIPGSWPGATRLVRGYAALLGLPRRARHPAVDRQAFGGPSHESSADLRNVPREPRYHHKV